MRTEDGELEAGDLVSGGYGALEADLGRKLRPLAGFGRDLAPVEVEIEDEEEETWAGVVFTPEFATRKGAVVYEFTTWSPFG